MSDDIELLRNVGLQLVRTKLGKCGMCRREIVFNCNPVGTKRRRKNLCEDCYAKWLTKECASAIRVARNQLTALAWLISERGSPRIQREIEHLSKLLKCALAKIERERGDDKTQLKERLKDE